MKAIVLEGFGGVDQLKYVDMEKPAIKSGEVLVRVKAISINPVDVKVRSGKAPLAKDLAGRNPLILGWDVSGEVAETGSEVTRFTVGDQVFGMVNFAGHGKAYAEYVAAAADHLTLKPSNISHIQAAASTLAALTAWQAFTCYGKLRSTDTVLIHAAAGGVGHFAVQIAKHIGAQVIATSSGANRDFVLELGADQHIDYRKNQFEQILDDIDFVLESVGGENFQKSVRVLKPFGTIVTLPSGHSADDELAAKEKKLHACYFMSVFSSGADMDFIASLLREGSLKPHVSHVFDFDQIAQAHQQIQTGRTVGKVIVTL
ncbi:NADP-dependent oxidoreductase [Dyadobacter luteus]|uniref:NADP-dependent oxidoreductase n=1 Tax=Dyadobacter luteus TaxID=2259619 RepID=A0A3D8YHU5_9BACT|nr:NADP-dependent oxidoreductase [Dyadobacter luteus]REA62889.1 NADP-dependent oxidoreductase [Dyadobacter luteus]